MTREQRMIVLIWNRNIIPFFPYFPCQDDDSSEEDKGDFSTFLQTNYFGYLEKPVPDNLKVTTVQHGPERYQNETVHLMRRMGDHFPTVV